MANNNEHSFRMKHTHFLVLYVTDHASNIPTNQFSAAIRINVAKLLRSIRVSDLLDLFCAFAATIARMFSIAIVFLTSIVFFD